MKSRTKWLTFLVALWFVTLMMLLWFGKDASASEFQTAKLLDCQAIIVDESFIPKGTKTHDVICFWEVEVNGRNAIMWKIVGKRTCGFMGWQNE